MRIPNNLFILHPETPMAKTSTTSITKSIPTEQISPFEDTEIGSPATPERIGSMMKYNNQGIGNLKR